MTPKKLEGLLKQVANQECSVQKALKALRHFSHEDLEFACVDHHRAIRQNAPEVIFAQGKTPAQVAHVAASVLRESGRVLITRASEEIADSVRAMAKDAAFDEEARVITIQRETSPFLGRVAVVSAGTSDMRVLKEAALCADFFGAEVVRVSDVGVAGIHRLLGSMEKLLNADVVIVVAGMEGALPSVVGGLLPVPVIAVPTSVGYGASFNGLAALLGMLNSCAAGVVVVNIDNGFGAAAAAHRILQTRHSAGLLS